MTSPILYIKARVIEQRQKMRHSQQGLNSPAVTSTFNFWMNGTLSTKNLDRVLPGYDEVVHVKDIINTEARFNNRKRDAGWLTPTAMQLLRTHLNLIRKICKFLPVSSVSIEVNKFSFMQLDNPHIKPWEYAKGPMHGFKTVKEALDIMQGRCCLLCGKPIECRHHLTPRSKGGMDTLENMAGLCGDCHEAVHKDVEVKAMLDGKKSGCRKRHAGTSVLNQIMPRLLQELDSIFHGNATLTDGYTTKEFREEHGIEETHASDAYCISCSALSWINAICANRGAGSNTLSNEIP